MNENMEKLLQILEEMNLKSTANVLKNEIQSTLHII